MNDKRSSIIRQMKQNERKVFRTQTIMEFHSEVRSIHFVLSAHSSVT